MPIIAVSGQEGVRQEQPWEHNPRLEWTKRTLEDIKEGRVKRIKLWVAEDEDDAEPAQAQKDTPASPHPEEGDPGEPGVQEIMTPAPGAAATTPAPALNQGEAGPTGDGVPVGAEISHKVKVNIMEKHVTSGEVEKDPKASNDPDPDPEASLERHIDIQGSRDNDHAPTASQTAALVTVAMVTLPWARPGAAVMEAVGPNQSQHNPGEAGDTASQPAALATVAMETLPWTRPGAASVEAVDPGLGLENHNQSKKIVVTHNQTEKTTKKHKDNEMLQKLTGQLAEEKPRGNERTQLLLMPCGIVGAAHPECPPSPPKPTPCPARQRVGASKGREGNQGQRQT